MKKEYQFLGRVNSPDELKGLDKSEILPLCNEIRDCIIATTEKNGGHLASNLGVVEITVAIHRVFDCPQDHIIFDVGHQSYTHKLLTGRYEDFDSLRRSGGISGFTNREESEYDCFGAGHSSTSLSAALGFAEADKILGNDAYTVVVLGDGAFTGGMIHEALNNCNKELKKLIIILNENEMSISKNIGRFATSLSKLRTSSGYFKTKRATGIFLRRIPLIGKGLFNCVKRVKMAFKSALYGSNYFESMGLTYLGPIDGNDREATEKLLAQAKKLNESVIVHVKTKKGKGYEPAESSPASYHGMPPRDVELSDGESFSTVVGHTLAELGRTDERICAITAAMSDGTGLEICRTAFPERFFDVGIAEEHALTFAAGLAANGMRPCAAIYSTFLQRGYDNIIHDIALQKLPVTMLIDRAGLNAKDGATHHGIFDVAFLSHIPNISIYTPVTYRGLIASMKKAIENGEPAAIRYPSGNEKSAIIDRFYKNGGFEDIGVKLDYSLDVAPDAIIVTHGRIALEAMRAADELALEGVKVGIMLLEKLKPYSESAELVKRNIPDGTKALLFLEEEIRSGGAGMNLCDKLAASLEGREIKHAILAVDDSFVAMGEQGKSILQTAGIDACAIKKTINDII